MRKTYSEPDMQKVSVVVKDVIMESTCESKGFDNWKDDDKWADNLLPTETQG